MKVKVKLVEESSTKTDKRSEPRRSCSVYITFGTGFKVETARIIDYSDSGLRIRVSSNSYLGESIEILESESPLFIAKSGSVVWQRNLSPEMREFGVRLAAEPNPFQIYKESGLDRMWKAIQKIALEDAFA